MLQNLPTLKKLVLQLQRIPYLASKNIYRVAAHFLSSDLNSLEQFCSVLLDAKKNVKLCKECFNWTENNDKCHICLNLKRDKSVICVVETWHDLLAIERAGGYNGIYHVLGGALSPLEGIGPQDLRIDVLTKRVNDKVREIIFATNPTPEGEATASYIFLKLEDKKKELVFSRLASGVPVGSSLQYMDRMTIHKAIHGRRPF